MSDMFPVACHMKVYLDVCCLNRPFDDQAQDRVHMEAEAVATILRHADRGNWIWVASEAVIIETQRIPDEARKLEVLRLIAGASQIMPVTPEIMNRSRDLMALGFGTMDALHVACAEWAKVDVFLTTDDRLGRLSARYKGDLSVHVANPWTWLEEIIGL